VFSIKRALVGAGVAFDEDEDGRVRLGREGK
jgi:hypothetical protein